MIICVVNILGLSVFVWNMMDVVCSGLVVLWVVLVYLCVIVCV